jgi:L-aminopeptidase/D-esterase-like protein
MPSVQDFEKLGLFYLGREYDLENRRRTEGTVLYDSRDLVTHAVCLGMTGSGKTGLCLSLLEEAAIDGVPAIAIDPKGDITNLLLTFPRLAPEEFRPWVAEDDARRKGLDPDAFAAAEAARWSKGLAEWGQDAARIERLRAAVEFSIYTPRSRAGRGLSILKSFAAPPPAVRDDADALGERIRAAATSLLSLVGLDADPIRSREHALVSTLLENAWRAGRDQTIEGIVAEVQRPPVTRIGALDLDSFFPEKDRFELAMRLNGLLAAPGFDAWLQGDPLDIGGLLFTPQGRPRVSIISTAHLSETERMFVTALVLAEAVAWVRAQLGTSSLRAILYMDEVFGYLPPVANPPSKEPLLTLLKQARAGGLGLVLATQNPVDLDYKALSNAGTWFLGRLQTERDKARVLDGLTSAAAGATFDRARADEVLSALTTRIFLMHNVHESEPVVFETRWAMSYLRGPLGRDEISRLSHGSPRIPETSHGSPRISETSHGSPRISAASRPVVPSQVRELFGSATTAAPHYEPALYASARLEYRDPKRGVDVSKTINYLVPLVSRPDALDFDAARETPLAPDGFATEPAPNATFGDLPPDALKVKSYAAWKQQMFKRLVQCERLELFRSDAFDLVSEPGESERDFRARLQARARETRDELTAKLRQKYSGRTAALTERIRRAEHAVARESEQMKSAGWQTAVSLGATVLGALLGRKTVSASTVGRATTTARGGLRSMKEREDVQRAEENVQVLKEQLAAIEAEAAAAIEAEGAAADPQGPLGRIALEPKPSKSGVEAIALAWIPIVLVLIIATTAGAQTKPRARDIGVPFDGTPGPLNAITDVGGVEVGVTTLTSGPARTGVTAILPRGKSSSDPAFAGWFSLNGNGEMTGTTWIEEAGFLEGAVFITNTHSVGVVRDAAIAWSTKHGKLFQAWSLPVVAETYDGGLNDINGFHVKPEHVFAALDGARGGPVAEGNVGGGTGMRCYGFKCGTGTASRKIAAEAGGYTVGVLVQANMGLRHQLLVAGAPVGKELAERSAGLKPEPSQVRLKPDSTGTGEEELGSIIIVVATDAPLLPHQLKRIARRASHGLARTGATSGNGSGDIFIAFSTANAGAASVPDAAQVSMVSNRRISALFEATVQATEEAIVNALVAAETMTGADGRAVEAISHDRLRDALRKYNRLLGR